MRVCIFTSTNDKSEGGPSRSVPILAKGVSKVGCDTFLMTRETIDMNFHALEGFPAVRLKILPYNITYKQLEQEILIDKYDIVHIQGIWIPIYHYVASIARKYGIQYIITPRGALEPWSLSQKKWKKKLAMLLYQRFDIQNANAILATANLEAVHLRALGFTNPIAVIPNGIDISEYKCRTFEDRDEIKKQILFLSRIHPKKGIEILIESWKRLTGKYKDWNVVIAGNGEENYISYLKELIKNNYLDSSVSIIPPVFGEMKRKLYCESSLFVLPTYSENFGMVIAEALACGIPVITTTGTPWEELNTNKIGWCVELSVENIVLTIETAIQLGEEKLFEMGQKGHMYVNDKYDYSKVGMKNKQLYQWILGENPDFTLLYK